MTISLKQDYKYKSDNWWKWSIWIDADKTTLDDIKFVEYTLHPTFSEPVREINDHASNFKLSAGGWGTFTIYAKIFTKNSETIDLEHKLELEYPEKVATKNPEDAPSKDAVSRDAPSKDVLSKEVTFEDAPSKDAPSKDAPSKEPVKTKRHEREKLIEKRIDESLKHPEYEWRTLKRVAIEAGVSEEVAANKLRAIDDVRFGRSNKTGETIVGLRDRVE